MTLLSVAEEIDLEQQVVVGILDSVLRIRGTERVFAERAGVSPVYVSYIRGYRRIPRMRTAERIAHALPLSVQQQEAWLYHVQRIRDLKRHGRKDIRQEAGDRSVGMLVDQIKKAHGAATIAHEPTVARSRYHQVRTSAELLLPLINPNRDPVNYMELCFLIHEALSVMNRNDEGLWYGKRARLVAENIDDPRVFHLSQEQADFFLVNAYRAEAVAYHNLQLDREALELCQKVGETPALRRNARFWIPHLYRDMINALEGIPRFAITEAEGLADQVRRICDTRADDFDGLLSVLIQVSLARAYIRHHNFKDALKILTAGFDRLYKTANIGTLHQVIFLRTFARLYAVQGAYGQEWAHLVQEASRIASQAGLEHQLNGIRFESGTHLENEPSRSEGSEG